MSVEISNTSRKRVRCKKHAVGGLTSESVNKKPAVGGVTSEAVVGSGAFSPAPAVCLSSEPAVGGVCKNQGVRFSFRGNKVTVNKAMVVQARAALNALWASDDWDSSRSDEWVRTMHKALVPFRSGISHGGASRFKKRKERKELKKRGGEKESVGKEGEGGEIGEGGCQE